MEDNSIGKYKNFYANLVRLYPAKFQERFAEPMIQTFGDMCLERAEAEENLRSFAIRTYAETFLQIIKEQFKEVIMNTKNISNRTILIVSALIIILVIGTILTVTLNSGGNIIKPGSTIEQAKSQSQGDKVACLPNNESAVQEIKETEPKSDQSESDPYYSPTMNFDGTLLSGIIDVPAGTQADVTFNSFQDNIAKGSANYESDYGDYNYEMKYLGQPGEWELVSLVACIN